jgi:hypothetical protein
LKKNKTPYNSASYFMRGEVVFEHFYYFYTLLTADSYEGRKPAQNTSATVTSNT